MDTTLVRVKYDHGPYGELVRAVTPIAKGETIFHLTGEIVGAPTKYTIQIDADRHLLANERQWQFINHGCEPNVHVDTELRVFVAARDIEPGEELKFNYNSTEWSMVSSFVCGCGAPTCASHIRGFKYLDRTQREAIRPYLSPFIQRQWIGSAEMSADEAVRVDLRKLRPEVHVLIPYGPFENGRIASPEYDTGEFREELSTWFSPMALDHVWTPVTLQTLPDVIRALQRRSTERDIVVLNLCDGTEGDKMPGQSVVHALERSGLPFSGAGFEFYVNTTSKLDTKRLLVASGVSTSPYIEIKDDERDPIRAVEEIGFPLIVKPDKSAGSSGIHIDSVCYDVAGLKRAVARLRADPEHGLASVFAERFIGGREFTCLVVEDDNQPLGLWVMAPGERVFDKRAPADQRFLAYERYWGLPESERPIPEGEPYYWYEPVAANLREQIADIARRAMRAVSGNGYARIDLRYSEETQKFYVLEVNSQCGLSDSDEATVGSMLKMSGITMSEVVERILSHAMLRARQPVCA